MASAEPTLSLGELRQHVLMPLLSHPLFSDSEHLRANQFAYQCADIARLIRWGESVQAEIVRREVTARAEAAHLRRQHALSYTLGQVRLVSFRRHCPHRPAPDQPTSFPSPSPADRRAGTVDRLAAARFQPATSLTLADLLSFQSR